ncbi:MAG: hypothetical protein DMG30_00730 [Acidobacteria bacterium]|nr:MAG: hypothetical protein DMG30_00730 [Acidobacteriota bacterium]
MRAAFFEARRLLSLLRTKRGMDKRVALIRDKTGGEGARQMKRTSLAIAVVAAIAASYGIGRYNSHSQPGNKTGRHVLYYVDPMHPSYKSDKPGIASDCGMPLVPVFAEDLGNGQPSSPLAGLPAGVVALDAATQRLIRSSIKAGSYYNARLTHIIHES